MLPWNVKRLTGRNVEAPLSFSSTGPSDQFQLPETHRGSIRQFALQVLPTDEILFRLDGRWLVRDVLGAAISGRRRKLCPLARPEQRLSRRPTKATYWFGAEPAAPEIPSPGKLRQDWKIEIRLLCRVGEFPDSGFRVLDIPPAAAM